MGTKLYKNWWLLLLKGVLSAGMGLFLLLAPGTGIIVFATLAAILIGLGGIALIIGAITHRRYNFDWTWWLMEGLFDVIIALLIIANPAEAAAIVMILIAAWVLIMGVIQIITAINVQYYLPGNLIFILTGVVAVILGFFILFNLSTGLQGIIILFGIFTLFYGISQIYVSVIIRKIVIEQIGEIEDMYLK